MHEWVKGYYSLFWRSIMTSVMESVFRSCIPHLNKNKRLLRSVLQRVRNLKSFKELTGKQLCRSLFLITLQAISSHHLRAKNQQKKQQNNAWNLFKVSNKDTRTTSLKNTIFILFKLCNFKKSFFIEHLRTVVPVVRPHPKIPSR